MTARRNPGDIDDYPSPRKNDRRSIPEHPELAISISRERMRKECPRQYWYRYVGHWNGWLDDISDDTRMAYLAGKRETVATWLGKTIHGAISRYLVGAGDVEVLIRDGAAQMRQDYQVSKQSHLRLPSSAKIFGFIDHFWNRPIPVETIDESIVRFEAAVKAFDVFCRRPPDEGGIDFRQLVQMARKEQRFVEVERPGGAQNFAAMKFFAPLEGLTLPIYAQPDLAVDTGDTLLIVDWKTGSAPTAETYRDSFQLQIYALRYHLFPPKAALKGRQIEGYDFYVPDLRHFGDVVLEKARRQALEALRNATVELTSLLNGGARIPKEAMPPTPSPSACRHCLFNGMCSEAVS